MADFITLHPEEWVALISGLRFSALVANAKLIFIPVIILVIGWSLLIWLQRLEKDREWNAFVLWLIFSSAILLSAFRTQKVVVELNPIVLNSKSMMLSVRQEEVKVDEKKQTLYAEAEASGISALLAIPDKIASLMFNFMDADLLGRIAGQAKTVPLDNMACKDPRYVAGVVQTLTLDWVLGLSMKKDDDVNLLKERIRVFSLCYQKGFEGGVSTNWEDIKLVFSGKGLEEAAGRGLITTLKASPFLVPLAFTPLGWKLLALGAAITFVVGAVGEQTFNLVKRGKDGFYVSCEQFVAAFKKATEDLVGKCEEILGEKRKEEERKAFVNAVLVCLSKPDEIPDSFAKPEEVSRAKKQCSDLREKTLYVLEMANQAVDDKMYISKGSPVKNFFAGVVSEVKAWWFSTTYLDFPLKFDLLAKGQGIVLALLTGMFPFVAVLSVIPTGRNFMNWPLLLNFMIAYFLVKMWIPLLFFIVNVAGHNLTRIIGV
jgi:hypothetical protein